MRNILLLSIILFTCNVFTQTNYYVSNSEGNDLNTGLSELVPWKTINRVETEVLEAGDTVFFKRGDTWREELSIDEGGSESQYLHFGTYGTGDRAEILGSDTATGWTNVTGNIWRASQLFDDPFVGFNHQCMFVELGGSITWGWDKATYTTDLSNLIKEYQWTWNNDSIYVYALTNPDDRYSMVEVPQLNDGIQTNNNNYISFEGLRIAYWKETGFRDPSDDFTKIGLIIDNLEIDHIGEKGSAVGYGIYLRYSYMTIKNTDFNNCGRRAITTMVISDMADTLNRSNLLVENNTFHNGYHTTGLDLGVGDVYGVYDSVIIRNNHFYEDPDYDIEGEEGLESNFLYFENDQYGTYTNWYIYNNIFEVHNGKGIAFWNIDTLYIVNNTFYGINPSLISYQGMIFINGLEAPKTGSEVYVLNNITYNDVDYSVNGNVMNMYVDENVYPYVTSDYNLFYTTNSLAPFAVFEEDALGRYFMSTFTDYQTETGFDINSPTPADPLFIDGSNGDFNLEELSPAKDAATPLSFVTTDYYGNPRSITTPSIGAIEYSDPDSTSTNIVSFSFSEQSSTATIDTTNHTVDITVVYGTSVTSLTPTITMDFGATINPLSGVAQNFTSAVTYTVTSLDETTTQDWSIMVTVASPSTETDIVTFDITGQETSVVNTSSHTVTIFMAYGSNDSNLTPTITLSSGATIVPNSGVTQDFSSPITYTVIAEDGTTIQDWVITVTIDDYEPVYLIDFRGRYMLDPITGERQIQHNTN